MAQLVARLTRTLQFTDAIPAVLLSFALEGMLVGHAGGVYAFEMIEEIVSGRAKLSKALPVAR